MSTFWERLEALRHRNGNGSRSQVDKTNPPTRDELTNLLLLEMLQKQGEQMRLQNGQLQRLMEAWEKRVDEDNSYMLKRFASHHPLIYDGASDPKTFEDWIGAWRNCSTHSNALRVEGGYRYVLFEGQGRLMVAHGERETTGTRI